jgi:hypothetical protein
MELTKIYDKLGNNLITWAKEITHLFEQLSKKLTASISWEFINKQIHRKIEKWYDLVQDAIDDTEIYLVEAGIDEITLEIQEHIRKTFEPKLKEYQKIGNEFLVKYESIFDNLDPKALVELKDIIFEISVDNIINILKEMFDGRK